MVQGRKRRARGGLIGGDGLQCGSLPAGWRALQTAMVWTSVKICGGGRTVEDGPKVVQGFGYSLFRVAWGGVNREGLELGKGLFYIKALPVWGRSGPGAGGLRVHYRAKIRVFWLSKTPSKKIRENFARTTAATIATNTTTTLQCQHNSGAHLLSMSRLKPYSIMKFLLKKSALVHPPIGYSNGLSVHVDKMQWFLWNEFDTWMSECTISLGRWLKRVDIRRKIIRFLTTKHNQFLRNDWIRSPMEALPDNLC